jgi:hypothetical protein
MEETNLRHPIYKSCPSELLFLPATSSFFLGLSVARPKAFQPIAD